MSAMTPDIAANFARIALGHVTREYPHKLDHVLNGDADALTPRVLHPVFYGSFDWHSCVHGWWMLLTLRRLHPEIAEAATIEALANASFAADSLATELAYLDRSASAGFERPYGWAWLLALHLEASRHADRNWANRLEPLARAFALRLRHYLSILTYPIRTGTHFNTAFALIFADEWARTFDAELADRIAEAARGYYAGDRDCQAWEPGGDEFLSSALTEALCMVRTQPAATAQAWLRDFLPGVAQGRPASLFVPVSVSDRSDGKIAHLDGLNLSRAWCWRALRPAFDAAAWPAIDDAIRAHLDAALPHVAGDYMGEHWLASFATLALNDRR